MPPVELEAIREIRGADLYEPLNIAKEYSDLKVEGTEKVGAVEAYVLVGQPSEGIPVRFYFDTKSGLLIRRLTVVPTPAGASPYQVDYEDYRDAGSGVKYPFRIHMEPAGSRTELDNALDASSTANPRERRDRRREVCKTRIKVIHFAATRNEPPVNEARNEFVVRWLFDCGLTGIVRGG